MKKKKHPKTLDNRIEQKNGESAEGRGGVRVQFFFTILNTNITRPLRCRNINSLNRFEDDGRTKNENITVNATVYKRVKYAKIISVQCTLKYYQKRFKFKKMKFSDKNVSNSISCTCTKMYYCF